MTDEGTDFFRGFLIALGISALGAGLAFLFLLIVL